MKKIFILTVQPRIKCLGTTVLYFIPVMLLDLFIYYIIYKEIT